MLSKEFVGLLKDETGVIKYVKAAPTEADLKAWYESKKQFLGLQMVIKSRLLWYGKPLQFTPGRIIMLTNAVLFLFLVWKLSHL